MDWIKCEDKLPPPKNGWQHSDRALVYYRTEPSCGKIAGYGIAYYHYNPPLGDSPHWVDFANFGRIPICWTEIQSPL